MAGNSQMTMEEFRRSRATASASKTGGNMSSLGKHSSADLNKKMDHARQSSALAKRTATGEDEHEKSVEERCEKAKLLREKQLEDRKRKNEERRTAVEDRRRLKEKEESVKNAMFKQLLDHKPSSASRGLGSGRKLPNLPANGMKDGCYPRRDTLATRRLSSGSSSGDSPTSHTPPGSTTGSTVSRRNLTGPTSRSTSCLSNVGNGQVQSRIKSNLGNSKKTSSSTNNLTDKPLGNNRSTTKVKEKTVASRAVGVSGLPKAQSTGAIHQLGHGGSKHLTSRPPSNKKPKAKASTVHHAGSSSEQEAKLALAEHRRKIREEAERQALLDKEKQEELRKQREEEEKQLAEENAKESARQAELAKMLKEQEEERGRLLHEQREKEEAERTEAEMKRKEEMELVKKQELERRAKEAEKREKEEEERLKREEEERQERRKRVEMIMSRTRMTAAATTSNNSSKMENYSSQEDLSKKASDESKYHSTTVSEILQKVKSRSSPNPEQDAEKHKENEAILGIPGAEKDLGDYQNENPSNVLRTINDTSKLDSLISETNTEEIDDSPALMSLPLRQHPVGSHDSHDGAVATRTEASEVERQGGDLWGNVEHFMQSSESRARGKLEQNGAVAEDDDDEDGEEGQLWKVIEGKREISEVV